MDTLSGRWIGIIIIILGILVLVLPALIQWAAGIGLIVIGVQTILRSK